jgi:exosortase A
MHWAGRFGKTLDSFMKLKPVALSSMAMPGQEPDVIRHRRIAMALALSTVFWLLAWYGDTAQSMVAIWQSTDTFAHGFLIAPISAWMIWQRRHAVAALDLRPDFRALPMLALAGFGWLLGQMAGAGVVQQFGIVLMIPLVVWAILGYPAVRTLAFPLFFLLFAVPFGEFLESPLMEYTADFTVAALKLTGIPVYREGLFFMIPSGSWSVVEACGGLRYLIASLTVGVLYAYLTYRSLARRAIFVALSVVVPIVANWLRAYMIVMIGHLSEMKYAVGIDHLIYGWLFFGVVILILFWIGSYWREDRDLRPAPPRSAPRSTRPQSSLAAIMAATIAAAGVVAVWPEVAERLEDTGPHAQPTLHAPPPAGDWQPVVGHLTDWGPRFLSPSAYIHRAYGNESTRAGFYVGYYQNHRPGVQLISSRNTLVRSDDRVWRNMGDTRRTLVFDQGDLSVTETKLRSRSASLLVWCWYWVDGQYIANPYWAKLLQAKSSLLGRGNDGAVVIVYAPHDERPQDAERALKAFVGAMLPSITRSLEYARRVQPSF